MAGDDKAGGLRRHHFLWVWLVALSGGLAVGIKSDSIILGFLGSLGAIVVAGVAVVFWLAATAIVSGVKDAMREEGQTNATGTNVAETRHPSWNVGAERERLREEHAARNAKAVEAALAAVRELAASEAARSGWLGELDFTNDIAIIRDNFQRAEALRETADTLFLLDRPTSLLDQPTSVLDQPNDDDRRLLRDATNAIADLEAAANRKVDLIRQCAASARRIDGSLKDERQEADNEAKRAELQAKLSAMLFGVEVAHDRTAGDSAVDAVMSRVHAYREIKEQIRHDPRR